MRQQAKPQTFVAPSVAVFDDFDASYASWIATEETGRRLGLKLRVYTWPEIGSWEPFYELASNGRVEALDVLSSATVNAKGELLAALASKYRLPAIYDAGEYVRASCLMSYGPNLSDLIRRAASYVDKIIRGAKSGELSIEQPTKFELLINLKTANALGLNISDSFLQRADEVIK